MLVISLMMFCLNLSIEMCSCCLFDQSTHELRQGLTCCHKQIISLLVKRSFLWGAKGQQVRRSPSLKGGWTHSKPTLHLLHYINPSKLKYFVTVSKTLASFTELEWLKSLSCLSTMNVLQWKSDGILFWEASLPMSITTKTFWKVWRSEEMWVYFHSL